MRGSECLMSAAFGGTGRLLFRKTLARGSTGCSSVHTCDNHCTSRHPIYKYISDTNVYDLRRRYCLIVQIRVLNYHHVWPPSALQQNSESTVENPAINAGCGMVCSTSWQIARKSQRGIPGTLSSRLPVACDSV